MKTATGTKVSGPSKKGSIKVTGTIPPKVPVPLRKDRKRATAAAKLRAKQPKPTAARKQNGIGNPLGARHTADAWASFAGVQQTRGRLGLTQPEFGRVIGCSTRSVAGFEADKAAVKPPARRRVIEADRLGVALAQIIPASEVAHWLKTPNPAFEGQTPLQVVERGEADRLWQMIRQIDAGVAN